MKFWNKKIKDTALLAEKLNVDEEKIKELKNGEREITGSTMDKVLEVINNDEYKAESAMKKVEILQWYFNTDLKKLRRKFGYKTQLDLARALQEQSSELSRAEAKQFKKLNRIIIKLYYFYENDFNRKIDKLNKDFSTTRFYKNEELTELIAQGDENEKKKIIEWFNNNDVRSIREKIFPGITQTEVCKIIGVPQSTYSGFETKQFFNKSSSAMAKVYNIFQKALKKQEEKEKMKWMEETPKEAHKEENTRAIVDTESIVLTDEKEGNTSPEIVALREENARLKKQIERYEKLIDSL